MKKICAHSREVGSLPIPVGWRVVGPFGQEGPKCFAAGNPGVARIEPSALGGRVRRSR